MPNISIFRPWMTWVVWIWSLIRKLLLLLCTLVADWTIMPLPSGSLKQLKTNAEAKSMRSTLTFFRYIQSGLFEFSNSHFFKIYRRFNPQWKSWESVLLKIWVTTSQNWYRRLIILFLFYLCSFSIFFRVCNLSMTCKMWYTYS